MTYEELRAKVRDQMYPLSLVAMEREHQQALAEDHLVRAMYIREYITEEEQERAVVWQK